MLRIGLTGGIGSGKSSVSQLFADLGIPIVDADQIAQQIVQAPSPWLDKIVAHFGPQILLASGDLDRQQLRTLIFNDVAAKQWLEDLLHPPIRQIMQEKKFTTSYAIYSIPLLTETGHFAWLDSILLVEADERLRIKRSMQRDQNAREQIEKIIQLQSNDKQRRKIADDVIENNGSLEQLETKVLALHQKYLG